MGRILPDLRKQFLVQAYGAFDRVVVGDGTTASMEEQYLADESRILQKPNGQPSLLRFLSEKNLIYQPTDALDVNRFVTSILPGTTPTLGQSDVFTSAAVHERILSAPALRLVPGPDVVRNTLLKAVAAGKIIVKTVDVPFTMPKDASRVRPRDVGERKANCARFPLIRRLSSR